MFILPEDMSIKQFQSFWTRTPSKIKKVLLDNITEISYTDDQDSRLQGKRAILEGTNLFLVKGCDLEEIWHEAAHLLLDALPQKQEILDSYKKDEEALADELYFLLYKGIPSDFWIKYLTASIKTASVSSIDIIDAALDTLATLVLSSDDESYIWALEIAKEAVKDLRKEDMLSYESREAPRQYYYREDLALSPLKTHQNNPLEVSRVDVTPRGNSADGLGLV